jgi:hypothetical protein
MSKVEGLESSPKEFLEGLSKKSAVSRQDLLEYGDGIFKACFVKIYGKTTSAPDRLGYLRVVVSLISALGPVIRDEELGQLKLEVADLRRIVEHRVS